MLCLTLCLIFREQVVVSDEVAWASFRRRTGGLK